jgi:RNA polymerase sigma-70 factor (ECF subfamily)
MGIPHVVGLEFDADTIEGCRIGDPAAQRRVFERYKDRVFSIALNFLKGDHAGAQDITQEVFVKVFRAATSFRQDARLSTWLYRITANACMDKLRRRRRIVLFGNVPSQLEEAVNPDEPTEMDPELKAAVARLSPKLRIAVLLRYFDDLSYDEIAEALGVTPGTIASRLNRAHKFLARELAPTRGPAPTRGDQ